MGIFTSINHFAFIKYWTLGIRDKFAPKIWPVDGKLEDTIGLYLRYE